MKALGKIRHLLKGMVRARGRLDSWWARGQSSSRTKYYAQINTEMAEVLTGSLNELRAIDLELQKKNLPQRVAEQRALESATNESQIALTVASTRSEIALLTARVEHEIASLRLDLENKLAVSREATKEFLTPEVYLQHRTMRLNADLTTQAKLDDMNLWLQKELATFRMDLAKAHELRMMELKAEILLEQTRTQGRLQLMNAETANKVAAEQALAETAAALIHQKNMAPFLELDDLNRRLAALQVQKQSATAKEQLDRIEKHSATLRKVINERSKQLS